jgi:hypothetical protein
MIANEAVIGLSQACVKEHATSVYRVPYIYHVISIFNTCSQVPTMARSLTDTDGGYHLGDLGLPHYSPHPSQLMILPFPLNAPSGIRFTFPTINSNN